MATEFEGSPGLLALLVNESRSRRPDISQDLHSRDWIPPKLRGRIGKLWDDYSRLVYPFDDVVLSVRNRFFLDLIRLTDSDRTSVIIAPCGLTSYPFLANENRQYIESDLEEVIAFKKRQTLALQRAQILPDFRPEWVGANMIEDGAIGRIFKNAAPDQPWLLIMEGLSYYLPRDNWQRLIGNVIEVLRPGDTFAFDYWDNRDANKQVYKRFLQFCVRHAGFNLEEFNFLDVITIRKMLPGFKFDFTDVVEQERRFSSRPQLGRRAAILRDRYVVARRVTR